jgi:hypothetical protein
LIEDSSAFDYDLAGFQTLLFPAEFCQALDAFPADGLDLHILQ